MKCSGHAKALWQGAMEVEHCITLAGPMAWALGSSFRLGSYCVASGSHFNPLGSVSIQGFLNACADLIGQIHKWVLLVETALLWLKCMYLPRNHMLKP